MGKYCIGKDCRCECQKLRYNVIKGIISSHLVGLRPIDARIKRFNDQHAHEKGRAYCLLCGDTQSQISNDVKDELLYRHPDMPFGYNLDQIKTPIKSKE